MSARNGWPVVGWATLVVLGMVAGTFAVAGVSADRLRLAVRATFVLAFVGAAAMRVRAGRLGFRTGT